MPSEARTPDGDLDVAIIGAGISGLCIAIQLKWSGFERFVIYDKAERLGGTWRDNSYPGSGCDVPSFLYSFSFEPKTDWTRAFAEQSEILEYLEFCADKYQLRSHFRLGTEMAGARFDASSGRWRLWTKAGEEITARVLVCGCGQLNRPFVPDLRGASEFGGVSFHSARWRHDHDLTGRRVAVIGNGASAIQLIPRIAPDVAELHIFQRTANWIVPKPDRPYSEAERKFYTRFPLAVRLQRLLIWVLLEMRWPAFSRQGRVSRWIEGMARKKLEEEVSDPKLREVLTPDYRIGCKRILISNDYYQALGRDNVEVVTSPVERVLRDAIRTEDGTVRPVDTIVYATGFQSTSFLAPMRIEDASGRSLDDAWRDGAEAYLGVAVSGFPNFFMLYGPNTNLGHNSIILMIECQVRYVMQMIRRLFERNLRSVAVRPDVMDRYNEEIQDALRRSVWSAGCSSWYKNDSGKVTNNWAYSTIRYWWRTRRPDLAAFDLES